MSSFLQIMPLFAGCVVIVIAITALFVRAAWPSSGEALLFFFSIACIYGTLRFKSLIIRILLAIAWVVLLIVHGMQAPVPFLCGDFQNFYDGAHFLFERGISPYQSCGTNAFPFPTFLLVYGLSLGGRLPMDVACQIFSLFSVLLLASTMVIFLRVVVKEISSVTPNVATSILMVGLCIHPAIVVGLHLGQSSMLAGTAVAFAVWLWRCDRERGSLHAAAILLNLAWMIKPHLLMASGFFLGHLILSIKQKDFSCNRAARIGKLFLAWATAILCFSALIAYPTHFYAYLDFPTAARQYMTILSMKMSNNYAIPAIISKASVRYWEVPYLQMVSVLGAGIALCVIIWNLWVLFNLRRESVGAFIPWLMSSLFWATSMWEHYLSLILVGTIFLYLNCSQHGLTKKNISTFWFATAIGCTMVFSSFIFTAGVILLYFLSIYLLTQNDLCTDPSGSPSR